MGRVTGEITYNLADRGRTAVGSSRDWDMQSAVRVINSPATQEMVDKGDMLGYLEHLPRTLFNTCRPVMGGLVGGMAGMAIFCLVYRAITGVNLGLPLCVALGLLGALLGELGDLSFSAVKRQYGIKDYGRLLPGHGGVLDRFDSVLFAAPVLYALLRALAA